MISAVVAYSARLRLAARASRLGGGPRSGEQEQLLAEVLAAEEALEGARRALEAFLDVDAVRDAALGDPPRQLLRRLREARGIVDHDEPLHAAAAHHEVHQVARSRRRLRLLLPRDPAPH